VPSWERVSVTLIIGVAFMRQEIPRRIYRCSSRDRYVEHNRPLVAKGSTMTLGANDPTSVRKSTPIGVDRIAVSTPSLAFDGPIPHLHP